jgi:ABC-type Fe3+-hydroxamate transport system substrate-binding protein
MSHTQLAALALAAASLALCGCGGSSKTTVSTAASSAAATTATTTTIASTSLPAATTVKVAVGAPLTRAQLLAKGDAICARINVQVDKVTTQASSSPNVSRQEFYEGIPKVARDYATEANELSKLVPPASLAHNWETILSDLHRYVQYEDLAAHEAEVKDAKAIVALIAPAEAIHAKLDAIAKRDGFRYCSVTE